MSRQTKQRTTGGGGGAVALLWAFYSQFNTATDLPRDLGGFAKVIADPPAWLPWVVALGFILLFAWSFWPDKSEVEPASPEGQTTYGDGSHAIASIQTANFNSGPAEPALRMASASQTVEILKNIEEKYCRLSLTGLMNLLRFDDTFRNNIKIVVGTKCGRPYLSEDELEEAYNFFEGGGSILTTHMSNFSEGPLRELTLPPGEVVHVNFCKETGEVWDDLSSLSMSSFLPADVREALEALCKAIHQIFPEMIIFLNDRFKRQRVRLIAAVNDMTVAGGLSNEFLHVVAACEKPISDLREAIRRSLSNG